MKCLDHCRVWVATGLTVIGIGGCGPSQPAATQPASASDRQQQALHDPMGYSPHVDKVDNSAGDIGHLDKEGFDRDLNHVLNP